MSCIIEYSLKSVLKKERNKKVFLHCSVADGLILSWQSKLLASMIGSPYMPSLLIE